MRGKLPLIAVVAAACDGAGIGSSAQPLGAELERCAAPQSAGVVLGPPAILPDGSRVEAQSEDEPGESALWLVPADGSAPRVLAPAKGADELPVALPDGRIVFQSTRSGWVSWWRFDPRSGDLQQLTNVDRRPGDPLDKSVPGPAGEVALRAGRIRYQDGEGRRWSLDPHSGAVEVER